MRSKFSWLFLSLLALIAVLAVSCQAAPTTTTGTTTTATTTTSKPATTTTTTIPAVKTTAPSAEKPQYGGIGTIALGADIQGFDEATVGHTYLYATHLTNEELLTGNWAIGPAGTGEANFILGGINNFATKTGALADSWSIPTLGKMVFHIRAGVHFQDKPPTSGREVTVDDIIYNLKRMTTAPRAYINTAYHSLAVGSVFTGDNAARTVTIEAPISEWANLSTLYPDYLFIYPPEAIAKFGDLTDWRNACGTGPFMITDFISNGSATFKRNPNYWGTDPVGPGKGNQLPYLDGVKILIIPDVSTRMTAMRVGKLDGVAEQWDYVKDIIQGNSQLQYKQYVADSCYAIAMRTDKPDLAFAKKEVRQALTMAIDFNSFKDQYYSGKAEILVWPVIYTKEYAAAYVPLDKLPANVQELYSHNITKAKKLLTDAGYPTGFKATMITYNNPTFTDVAAQFKAMWADIGVDLTINAVDYAVWFSRVSARSYDELLYSWNSGIGTFFKMINFRGTSQYNVSYVNDPQIEKAWTEMQQYVGVDEAKLNQLNAALMPYLLEQAYVIGKPNPWAYVVWWPWVKNYHGELQVGYYNLPSYMMYEWQDQALKKKLTGQ